jgi:histidyl-tRNA synthetase
VLGPDERAAGTVVVKDLSTGEQQSVPLADAPEHILRLLAR